MPMFSCGLQSLESGALLNPAIMMIVSSGRVSNPPSRSHWEAEQIDCIHTHTLTLNCPEEHCDVLQEHSATKAQAHNMWSQHAASTATPRSLMGTDSTTKYLKIATIRRQS